MSSPPPSTLRPGTYSLVHVLLKERTRPLTRSRASTMVTSYPADLSSYPQARPENPPPMMTTRLPAPHHGLRTPPASDMRLLRRSPAEAARVALSAWRRVIASTG